MFGHYFTVFKHQQAGGALSLQVIGQRVAGVAVTIGNRRWLTGFRQGISQSRAADQTGPDARHRVQGRPCTDSVLNAAPGVGVTHGITLRLAQQHLIGLGPDIRAEAEQHDQQRIEIAFVHGIFRRSVTR